MRPSADNVDPPRRRGIHRLRLGRRLAILIVVAVVLLGVLAARSPVTDDLLDTVSSSRPSSPAPSASSPTTAPAGIDSRCPWLGAAMARRDSAGTLARLVVRRMTTAEKIGEIVLVETDEFENINAGVSRLCIPALTLQDGPQGVAFGATGVTQLPAPLGIAASFDPNLARHYGEVEGTEATGQGIDVVQGPDLNIDRVPEGGRAYEGYGEDPLLVAAMGVANIEGIQSMGAMAMAKHFAVYSQETDRGVLDDVVSERAVQELYLPPFEAAVTKAHVASVMCAYPQLNGTYQCQDPQLLGVLRQWGFTGFVRSDLGSVHNPVDALGAGTDLIKPTRARTLIALVGTGRLPMASVDAAVTKVLTKMFAFGLVGQTSTGTPDAPVDSDAHTAFALAAAEQSAVLLKDERSVLPLRAAASQSVAVIGADADAQPVTTGYGSSFVVPPMVSLPLDAIRHRAGSRVRVTYSDGGSTTGDLAPLPTRYLTPSSGGGSGLTLALAPTDPDPALTPIQTTVPTADVSLSPHPVTGRRLPTVTLTAPVDQRRAALPGQKPLALTLPSLSATRTHVVLPAGWPDAEATLTGTLTPPNTGRYTLSLQGSGAATLSLDGKTAVSDPLVHGTGRWSAAVDLSGGHSYQFDLQWDPIDSTTPTGTTAVVPSQLTLGWQPVSDQIAEAVAEARRAKTAVVFVGDFTSEAFDRPSLSLPGDENALIEAVAAANPRTVVVLNTGGAVLMPWLDKVAGVIEAWYPGEEDGAAIAALLYGDASPAGRLPITFPATEDGSAVSRPSEWPGVDLTATYSEGLDVGYRYYNATGIHPLYAFGFGLSYTRFALEHLTVPITDSVADVTVSVDATNTGATRGTDVVQAYVTDPAGADEPPDHLAAFARVSLRPDQTKTVTLSIPQSAFQAYLGDSWTTVPGIYTVSVGQSSSNLPLSVLLSVP